MLAIDLKTLFLFLIIGNTFTIIFFFIYIFFYYSRVQKLNEYVIARVLQSITWVAYYLNYRDLDSITMGVTMIPLAFGVALEIYCLLTANQQFVKKKFLSLFSIATIFSIFYFWASDNVSLRVVIASSFLSIFYGYTWIDFSIRKNRSKMQRAAGWIGFLVSALFLNRAIHTLSLKIDLVVHSQLYFNVLAGIGLIIICFAWPLIFLLLNNEYDKRIILEKDTLLSEKNEQLEKYNTAKDKLFRILSHDLRSPLSSMISFLDLVMYEIKEENYANIEYYAKMISQSAQEGYELLDNLLNWTVLQSGKEIVTPQKIDIEKLTDHIISLFQISLETKKIQIIKNIEPELCVFADRLMIETVVRNLISNAIKFSHNNGSIKISAYKEENNVIIEIKDTGIGINHENIKKMFDIKRSFSSEGTNHEKGTGLGLILCKEFIEKNNGTIEVSSEIGKGSAFKIILPDISS